MILKNCDMCMFSKEVGKKDIVCYGIGDEFHNLINNFSGYPWCANIRFLVDGNIKKRGCKEQVQDRELTVMSLEDFLALANENMVLVVTCGFFKEIVKLLNEIPQLDKMSCYIYYFMMSLSEHKPVQIRQTNELLIPPTIHYCWFGGKKLPDFYKRCIESWHKHCPNYEIVRWDESNCDISETLFTKQAYQVRKYGFVPDYFRLKIIYEHGGIYLDTDVELLKNLDDLRYNHGFCGMEVPGRVNLGLGFGAEKGHAMIQYLLKRYQKMLFLDEMGQMIETASPIWQTMDLKNIGMPYGNKVHLMDRMTIYPVEVLSPKNIVTGELDITENSYSVHHFDGSWVTGDGLKRKQQREMDVNWVRNLMK